MEDKVIFAEKDKQRLLERKLKKVDENIDDLVAMFLDFVKNVPQKNCLDLATLVICHGKYFGKSKIGYEFFNFPTILLVTNDHC